MANENPWPQPVQSDALHGLAGEIVRMIDPHSEGDPVAVLIQFLAVFGNMIGRSGHFVAQSTSHFCNLFAVLVGESAKARKGSSWGPVSRLFELVDPTWSAKNVVCGLSIGEGLIYHTRDAEAGATADDGDLGVADKRLFVIEEEFASVLKVMSREGNTLSPILRSAWDGKRLKTLTRNSPLTATGAHISIMGHITRDELKRYLNQTESANGFGNRFQWYCVKRSKLLPEGGRFHELDLSNLVERLRGALEFAGFCGEIRRNENATVVWRSIYGTLSEGLPGLLGSMTARREAQVMRLATLYALLDQSREIDVPHLSAGLAVDQYSQDSCVYLFGNRLGDEVADIILSALREVPQGLTRTEISHDILQRNRKKECIDRALKFLVEHGLIFSREESTDGRSAERWFAKV